MVISIDEEGVRFRLYLDGSERFMGPETSMAVQAALGSDIALAFDECTPYHVYRDYTHRSLERTNRWLDRCIAWHAEHAPDGQLCSPSSVAVYEDLRAESVERIAAAEDGVAGGLAGPGQEGDAGGRGLVATRAAGGAATAPAGHRRRGRHHPRGRRRDRPVRLRHADSPGAARDRPGARPRRALAARPGAPGQPRQPRADRAGLPRPACREHTRGYLHYLARAHEPTAARLVTLHNLTFMAELMRGIRDAIAAGELRAYSERVLAGRAPY